MDLENKSIEELATIYTQSTGNKTKLTDKKKLIDLIQKNSGSQIRPTSKSTIGNVKSSVRQVQISPPRERPMQRQISELPEDILIEKMTEMDIQPRKEVRLPSSRVITSPSKQGRSTMIEELRRSAKAAQTFNPNASFVSLPTVVSKDLMKVSLPTGPVSNQTIKNIKDFLNNLPIASVQAETVEATKITKRLTPKVATKVVEEEVVPKKKVLKKKLVVEEKVKPKKKSDIEIEEVSKKLEEINLQEEEEDVENIVLKRRPRKPKQVISPELENLEIETFEPTERITFKEVEPVTEPEAVVLEAEPVTLEPASLEPASLEPKLPEVIELPEIIELSEEEVKPKKRLSVKKKVVEEEEPEPAPKKRSATKKKVVEEEEEVTPVKKTSVRKTTPLRDDSEWYGMSQEEILDKLAKDYQDNKITSERSRTKDSYTVEKMKEALKALNIKVTTGANKQQLFTYIENKLKDENKL
jgi:hypothetical protein